MTVEVRRDIGGLGRLARLRRRIEGSPFLLGLLLQLLLFAVSMASKWMELFPIRELTFDDSPGLLSDTWQITAAFASIALAGLALVFQAADGAVIAAPNVRELLFEVTQFRFTVGLAMAGTMQLGFVAVFLDHSEAVVVSWVAVSLIVLAVTYAYIRAADILSVPGRADEVAKMSILRDLQRSLVEAHVLSESQHRLENLVPWEWDLSSHDEHALVLAPSRSVFQDAHLRTIRDSMADVNQNSSTLTASYLNPANGTVPSPPVKAQLVITSRLGSIVQAGRPLVVLRNASMYQGDLSDLEKKLSSGVRWSDV